MQVYLDEQGYVNSYAILGTLINGIEVNDLKDMTHFQDHYQSYKVIEGNLVFDETKESDAERESLKQELRNRRAVECFPIINRGQLWYESLDGQQRNELRDWYTAWLNVTESLKEPEKPHWL